MSKSYIFMLLTILSLVWGCSFMATVIMVDRGLEPIQILSGRWLIAAFLYLGLAIAGKARPDYRKPEAKRLILVGLVTPCAYMIFETYGIAMTSASMGAIFIAGIPAMALLIGMVFLRRKAKRIGVVAVIIAFAGVSICTFFSPDFSVGGSVLGYLIMAGATVTGGFYSHASLAASRHYTSLEITANMAFMGAILFTALNFIMGYGFETYLVMLGDWKAMAGILFLGVGCSFMGYLLFNYLFTLMDLVLVNNISESSITVVGVVAGILVTGDPFGWYTLVGLGLTLTGVYLSSKAM